MIGINDFWVLAAACVVWLGYATWVVGLVRKSDYYDTRQLSQQATLAYLVPFVGALLVHFMLLATKANEPKQDRNHVRADSEIDGTLGRKHHGEDE